MSKYTDLAMERRSQFMPDGKPAWNCCQAVVSVFAQDAGYDEDSVHVKITAMPEEKVLWKCPKCGRAFSRQNQDHYCIKPQNIDEYIEAQPESVQPRLREIRDMIRSAIPEAEEKISWSMPTFWKGRNIIHFAASKKHIGLYPGDEATAIFAEELKDYNTSKGTIRLSYDQELPAQLISRIAQWCYEKYKE